MELIDEQVSSILGAVACGEMEASRAKKAIKEIGNEAMCAQSICDQIWLGSFVESDNERIRVQAFISALFDDSMIGIVDIISRLEPESVPPEIQSVDILRRKRTQAKTKKVYNVPVFNLLSECVEGYAALTESVWSYSISVQPEQTLANYITYIKEIMGKYSLCPTRSLGVMLAILTKAVRDESKSALIALITSLFPSNRIESVLRFHLLAFGKTGDNSLVGPSDFNPSKAPNPVPSIGKTPQSFIRAIVLLHQYQAISLREIWGSLTPLDSSIISTSVATIQEEYKKILESVSRILAGSLTSADSPEEASLSPEAKLSQTIATVSNELGQSQKFMLIGELLKSNLFDDAVPFLNDLQRQFQDIPIGAMECISTPLLAFLNSTISSDPLSSRTFKALKFLGVYVGRDATLVSSLISQIIDSSDPRAIPILSTVLLPAISISSPNPNLTHLVWESMSRISAANRFTIYALWTKAYDEIFPLQLTRQQVINQTRNLLKRVVKGAQVGDIVSRNSHYQFAKIASTNPIPALRYMLSNIQVHFNYNLIEPYIEVTSKIPGLAQDIVQFLSCLQMTGSEKPPLNKSTATVEPWLSHLSEFMGRFYRKHPTCPLDGVMSMIALSLTAKGDILTSSTPGRVVLEAIIEYMGGFKLVQQLNADQIESISGGPVLTSLSLAGVNENKTSSEKAKSALKSALLSHEGVVENVIYSLTNQLNQLVSNQAVARQFMTGGGVKLLGILFDGISGCLHQLCDFLSENCSHEEYDSLIRSSRETLFSAMDEGIANHVLRPKIKAVFGENFTDLFWHLNLSDIHVPEDHYRKHLSLLKEKIGSQETVVEKAGDQKDSLRSAKRELVRLKETCQKLEDEMRIFVERNQIVMTALKSVSEISSKNLLEKFIARRVMLSIQDSIFCAKLVKFIYDNKVQGFNLVEFFDMWTSMLSQCVSCSSEGEIKIFAEFVNEMMRFVVKLREKVSASSSAWSSTKQVQHISATELKEAHHTWEGNITRAITEALENGEWCEKRNCLILISRTCESYPVIEANAIMLKSVVEKLVNDQAEDIATLALSLSRRIASLESKWMDKSAVKPVETPAVSAEAPPQLEIESMNVDEDGGKTKRSASNEPKPAQKSTQAPKEEVIKRAAQLAEKRTEKQQEVSRPGSKRATPSAQDEGASKRSRQADDRQDRDGGRDRGRSSRHPDSDTIQRNRDNRGPGSRR